MFSPATGKSKHTSFKDRNARKKLQPDSSPITPFADARKLSFDDSIANRPKTGTPAPWTSRLSVLARMSTAKKKDNVDDREQIEPVYVGEFPQAVHDEQTNFLRKSVPGEACIAGGMDKGTALSWMICGSKLLIWSYLSPAASKKCVALDLPSDVLQISNGNAYLGDSWSLCFVNWDNVYQSTNVLRQVTSVGVVLCNQKSRVVVYWHDVYSDDVVNPAVSLASSLHLGIASSPAFGGSAPRRLQSNDRRESILAESCSFNSLVASPLPFDDHICVALATSSNGELWQFKCSPAGIHHQNVYDGLLGSTSPFTGCGQPSGSKGYPRSLVWRFPLSSKGESNRQFFLLTDHEIQCFNVQLSANPAVTKVWSHEIISTDNDLGIKKDLAGQKRIWPLDIQVDERGKEITVLVAIFCKDRVTSSSYMQYSLLTMQYKSGLHEPSSDLTHGSVLQKKAPVQVIIPKARVEEEEFLFSMRLRVGGKPSGSAVILSGDGTATVSYLWANTSRLYQFDLLYDAGKVLDASVFPSTDDGEEGAWVVLTEKAGVWAIPEKAVLFGGVEPPERSLSRKGSSNERSAEEEKKNLSVLGNSSPVKANVDARDSAGKWKAGFTSAVCRTAQDEEAEALLSHLFHDFLLSGQVDGALQKLKNFGAFERDGETNAFARVSKSIVDTLAKHWTTTRGAEIVGVAVVSNQLIEKQQKHEKFLQFLALSRCHEELCMKQRHALQIILEHVEKLTGMIQLRELQNMISKSHSTGVNSQQSSLEKEVSGALWDLIQMVGERARRNTVLLMDRDNAEVFYSKISDLEEVFYCLKKHLDYIISVEQPLKVQVQRVCELSQACVTIIRSAMHYKNEHHMWYPPPDGFAPWYSQAVVREGLWTVASFMIGTLADSSGIDLPSKSDICAHLEMLANVVLDAYVGAITAKIERGEEHNGLSNEYWKRRDTLLDSLYQQIKVFANVRYQDSVDGNGEQKEVMLRELSLNLLSIARRHEAYPTLWNICCDLNNSTLLKELMHESLGPRGGFSYFVFEQLYENKQFSKLLRLGEEFPQELITFLKDNQDLLWLHENFLHQFSAASKTLHVLALSEDSRSFPATEKETVPDFRKAELTLPDRKRLLLLSKIAAAAGKDAHYEAELERIDADLKILKLQEDILKLLPDDMDKQQIGSLLPPWDLIKLCLKGGTAALVLRAFDVFAWTSFSFRRSNRLLLEECWKNAVDQDDWEKLYDFSIAEGWSDEDTVQALGKTVIFQASRRCYGPESETYEGGFGEVLPLRQDGIEQLPSMDTGSASVEAILMQHKDFPIVGKLMLAALMLGSAQADLYEEDGPIPME